MPCWTCDQIHGGQTVVGVSVCRLVPSVFKMRGEADERELDQPLSPKKERPSISCQSHAQVSHEQAASRSPQRAQD